MAFDQKGTTLLEILLSVSLIGILIGFSLPMYYALNNSTDLSIAVEHVANSWRRSMRYSETGYRDDNWGTYITQGSITVFKGSSYTLRDPAYDEIVEIGDGLTISGLTETNFSRLSGAPTLTGDLIITNTNNVSETLTLTTRGTVLY